MSKATSQAHPVPVPARHKHPNDGIGCSVHRFAACFRPVMFLAPSAPVRRLPLVGHAWLGCVCPLMCPDSGLRSLQRGTAWTARLPNPSAQAQPRPASEGGKVAWKPTKSSYCQCHFFFPVSVGGQGRMEANRIVIPPHCQRHFFIPMSVLFS
jgi:hypothetical protein